MERIFLMMPKFMGYDTALVKALMKCGYDVNFFNNQKYFYNSNSTRAQKLMKKVMKHIHIILNISGEYSHVICINGQYIPNYFYYILRKKNPKAKFICYLWDDVSNLCKTSHLKLFDKVFSFNLDDCYEYGMTYLPMYTQNGFVGHARKNVYDIAIIGSAHHDRLTFSKILYEKYKNTYNFYIYFYDQKEQDSFFCHSAPMDYRDYLDVLRKSKVLLDIPYIKQTGPTTRFYDALLTETKVITTNERIVQYPIFSDNILVIDRGQPDLVKEFIDAKYDTTAEKTVFDAGGWINTILGH